jgi:hypothetical protein
MYAIVRENTFDPSKLVQADEQLAEFQEVHSQQPGYSRTLVIDLGQGRQLTVNLWDTEEHSNAALPAMIPVVRRLIEPLMAGPSRPLGAGPVALTDLAPRRG